MASAIVAKVEERRDEEKESKALLVRVLKQEEFLKTGGKSYQKQIAM